MEHVHAMPHPQSDASLMGAGGRGSGRGKAVRAELSFARSASYLLPFFRSPARRAVRPRTQNATRTCAYSRKPDRARTYEHERSSTSRAVSVTRMARLHSIARRAGLPTVR